MKALILTQRATSIPRSVFRNGGESRMIQCDKFVVICVYVLVLLDPNRIKAVEYKDSVPSPGFYAAISKPNYVAATVATAPHDKVVVYGQPRVTSGHPNTIWDSEDINRYKEMLKSNQDLQFLFTQMKERLGRQILEPVNTPQPQRDAQGGWLFPGEYFPAFPGFPDEALTRFRRYLSRDAEAISDLGILYALGGDIRFAEYAKSLLLSYANASRFGAPKSLDYRFSQGLSGQLLDEALILEKLAFGYDLIYNFPSWTTAERSRVHDELFRPLASEMFYPGVPEIDHTGSFARQINNRGAIGSTSALLAGYATDDKELVNAALYGIRSKIDKTDVSRRKQFPPPDDWIAATAADPSNGLLTVHFASAGISGGMWVEGSPNYAIYALGSMVDAAEAAWHHGLNLYTYNDSILKYMFDFPIMFGYPDLTTPGENDAHRESMQKGYAKTVFEYAYRRYRDPLYLRIIDDPPPRRAPIVNKHNSSSAAIVENDDKHLDLSYIGSFPPSLFLDLAKESKGKVGVAVQPSVNYPDVGFGVIRTTSFDPGDVQSLILSYGPSASHGHPDKLHIDVFAFGDVLLPSPGIQFPYVGNVLIDKWYHTTLAHNTITVDEQNQIYWHDSRRPDVRADQIIYAPAKTIGLERAWTASAYKDVTLDRAVFLTDRYLADLFGAFSATPHRYDLAWHIRGNATSDLDFQPFAFPEPASNGYNVLVDVMRARPAAKPWSITFTRGVHEARLLGAADATAESLITGQGGVYVDYSAGVPNARPTANTIIERREETASTLFGNVLDLSDKSGGYVRNVTRGGGAELGYGTLRIETQDGVDICFASYGSGKVETPEISTDAVQALVRMKGRTPQTLYLGGGTELRSAGSFIRRDKPGLAYVEHIAEDRFIVGNPSPSAADISVQMPGLAGLAAYDLDERESRTGSSPVARLVDNSINIHLGPGKRVEIAK
jgi:Heparinase II/III-like protein/Alginate lyase